jgi:hypothetical protein
MLAPMRRVVWFLAVALIAGVGIVVADAAAAQFAPIGPGSVGIEPWADGFELLAAKEGCEEETVDEACAREYGFRPAATVIAWISVRNDGPVAVTLRGLSADWLGLYADVEPLGRPAAGLDGGTFDGSLAELEPAPFAPIELAPGDERIVGIEFETSGLAAACARYAEGGGVGWESVRLAWSWLFIEHEQELALIEPITFMAPTRADCS